MNFPSRNGVREVIYTYILEYILDTWYVREGVAAFEESS